jgi:hypothetical protein
MDFNATGKVRAEYKGQGFKGGTDTQEKSTKTKRVKQAKT